MIIAQEFVTLALPVSPLMLIGGALIVEYIALLVLQLRRNR